MNDADVDDVLSIQQLESIYRHALDVYPNECCGLIYESRIRRCANAVEPAASALSSTGRRDSSNGFAFGTEDVLDLNRSFDTDDPVLIIYHSHPDVGAYFSPEDAAFATMDGRPVHPVDHLVVDVTATRVRGAHLYRFSRRRGRYVLMRVFGDPKTRPSKETG